MNYNSLDDMGKLAIRMIVDLANSDREAINKSNKSPENKQAQLDELHNKTRAQIERILFNR